MFSIKIDNNIIKEVTEIDINLLLPHEKVIADKKDPAYNHYRRRIRIVQSTVAQTANYRRTFENVSKCFEC